MSNVVPIVPLPLPESDDPPTREVDGDEIVDADANDDLINSADADELASQEPADE
ncbi:hypothetical protein [uncultured Microbacterium sp.]|uniref:hypothetical protein n=1 Tax=uncultured Microbacterium sp. TaxID=191216 RepID=UPI0035C9A0A2